MWSGRDIDGGSDYINRLHIAFSFHYLELLRIHKLDDFFKNIKRIKNHGGSFVVQLNLCDEYEPYFEEIKVLCEKQLGALPQLVATRKENDLSRDIEYFTSHLPEEYVAIGSQFNSPLFDYTIKNFNVNRKEFCYAGDWGVLDLGTGILKQCYASAGGYNIFGHSDKKINFLAVGRCDSLFCMNSSHFMALGIIPEADQDISYCGLRNRYEAGWYNNTMKEVLSAKLSETNEEYNLLKKKRDLFITGLKNTCKKGKNIVKQLIFKK